MLALVAGLAGAIVGWLLKTVSDFWAERRANARADVIWRRTKYVDAVAEFPYSARALMAADARISRAIFSLQNAEAGGNPDIIAQCHERNREASEEQEPWRIATLRTLESVRLYGPDAVVDSADAVWEAILNGGQFPGPTEVRKFEKSVLAALERLRVEARRAASIEQPAMATSRLGPVSARKGRVTRSLPWVRSRAVMTLRACSVPLTPQLIGQPSTGRPSTV